MHEKNSIFSWLANTGVCTTVQIDMDPERTNVLWALKEYDDDGKLCNMLTNNNGNNIFQGLLRKGQKSQEEYLNLVADVIIANSDIQISKTVIDMAATMPTDASLRLRLRMR